MKKINIYGAGIAGLTVAHELIEKGFDVTVYEKDNIAGGMARTYRDKNNIPTEHSWRGYGPFYYNTFELIKRIPVVDNCNIKENFSNSNLDVSLEEDSDKDLKSYTIEEVEKHTSEDNLWAYSDKYVFDLTSYVEDHPGGIQNILSIGGKHIVKTWKDMGYGWHLKHNSVINKLKSLKIGKLAESFKNIKNVHDNLVLPRLNFKMIYDKKLGEQVFTYSDYLNLFYLFGKVILSDNRRKEYFKERLDPIIKKRLSKLGYHFIADYLAGPGYGFDKNSMSVGHYGLFLEQSFYEGNKKWQVMNQPTSEAWIDPWVKYLKSKGVKFNFNNELVNIKFKENKISKCFVKDSKNKIIETKGIRVIALNPFSYQKILKNLEGEYFKNELKNYQRLNIENKQISFRLGFNKKINFNEEFGGYVLIDSPFNITFYPQEDHWCKNINLGNNIKSLWSGTLILPYNKGNIYQKSGTSLKKEELLEEIIDQILNSKFLKNNIINKEDVNINNIIHKEIFPDWYFKNNSLKSKNKKWVNNYLNEEYRPSELTKYKNLYVTGSHCKTKINIWSMEGAVESGKRTANYILKENNKKLCFLHEAKSSSIIQVIQTIDNLLYQLNLPNILDLIILVLIIYILHYVRKKIN